MQKYFWQAIAFSIFCFFSSKANKNYEFIYEEISTDSSVDSAMIINYVDSLFSIDGKNTSWDLRSLSNRFISSKKITSDSLNGEYKTKHSLSDTGYSNLDQYYYSDNVMQSSWNGNYITKKGEIKSFGELMLPNGKTIINTVRYDTTYSKETTWESLYGSSTVWTYYIEEGQSWYVKNLPMPILTLKKSQQKDGKGKKAKLTFLKEIIQKDSINYCEGYSHKGTNYNSDSTFSENTITSSNIDSTTSNVYKRTNLFNDTLKITSCDSYSYKGTIYHSSGILPNDTNFSSYSCYTVTPKVLYIPQQQFIDTVESCQPYVNKKGTVFTSSGIVENDSLKNINGCDSIRSVFFFRNIIRNEYVDTIKGCQPYINKAGMVFSSSGIVESDTLKTIVGCDSIVSIFFTYEPVQYPLKTKLSMNQYCFNKFVRPNGKIEYPVDNHRYTDTLKNVYGCDSLVWTQDVFREASHSYENLFACKPVILNGNSYNQAAIYDSSYFSYNNKCGNWSKTYSNVIFLQSINDFIIDDFDSTPSTTDFSSTAFEPISATWNNTSSERNPNILPYKNRFTYDDSNWFILNPNETNGRGPSTDHSTGSALGKYLIHGLYRFHNAKIGAGIGRIYSNCIDLTEYSSANIDFWMAVGKHELREGKVRIYSHFDGKRDLIYEYNILKNSAENNIEQWKNHIINLNQFCGNMVVLEIFHEALESYPTIDTTQIIALDDIKINGNKLITNSLNSSLNDFNIAPNPTTGIIYFSNQVTQFSVLDMKGQLITEGHNSISADLSSVAPGIYFIRVGGKSFKIIKQ